MEKTAVQIGREFIAELAYKDNEPFFAIEVQSGAWDHRSDVALAISQAEKNGRVDPACFKSL